MDTAAPTPTTPEASGATRTDPEVLLRNHFADGYRRARLYKRAAVWILAVGIILVVVAAGGAVVQMRELGFFEPELNGLQRIFRDVYVATSVMLLTILGSIGLFGVVLRAASGARRAAVDAAVLASDLPDEEKADLIARG